MRNFDFEIRVLSCESCGAPVQAPEAGGAVTCSYCNRQMILERRRLAPARLGHTLEGEARLAKLRLQSGRDLDDNPYSTVRPPPGCEGLTRAGLDEVQAQLARRFREAAALVRADPSFEHQRLLWWCATQLNQGYGLNDKHLERRAVLERAIEEIDDPGFRHMLYVNLAGAAARFGEIQAARKWIERCDPEPEDIMLDSGYRTGLASVLVREGGAAQTLALVGPRPGDVPEAHQYRLIFAMYRIHAHEQLGDGAQALAAANAIMADPEVGGVLVEALAKNELAPKTAASLAAAAAAPGSAPGAASIDEILGKTARSPAASSRRMVLLIAAIVIGLMVAILVPVLLVVLRQLP